MTYAQTRIINDWSDKFDTSLARIINWIAGV
jgi:hypothetical protein